MRARKATYVTSATGPAGFPPPGAPEVAFAGRSNVGKSSLINTLTGAKNLARTSSTPGCTRQLNWFHIVVEGERELDFVDLPGYGYAKVPKAMRAGFAPLVETYVKQRDCLRMVVVILDIRRDPEDEERDLLAWLAEAGREALVVLTKADKLSKAHRPVAAARLRRELGLRRDPLLFSATSGDGVDELWRAILTVV